MTANFFTACMTDVGLRRKINEDGYLDRSEDGMWIVADGMGGHEAGEVASGLIVETLGRLRACDDLDRMTENAMDCVQTAHTELIALAHKGEGPMTIGSTVVGLVIRRGEYRCFWVGDSRIYRIRDRDITQLTRDHSLVQDLIDADLIDPADAEQHPDANVITRAVGADKELKIDVVSGKIAPGDLFLLASDGVTKVMNSEEIMTDLTTRNPKQALTVMAQTILSRGAPDNFTAIVVRVL